VIATSQPVRLGTAELLAIATRLAPSAQSWPGMQDPEIRSWHTVAATDRYQAFVIAWPVGGAIELHDHGDSAGAVVVAGGSLVETVVGHEEGGSLQMTSRKVTRGDHLVFGPGHVHDIVNHGPGPALSVHVYSPVLRSMTFFEPRDREMLVAVRTEEFSTPAADR
jgi:mannose-6-phosphate isomerase-like protein (cupin superfamily)